MSDSESEEHQIMTFFANMHPHTNPYSSMAHLLMAMSEVCQFHGSRLSIHEAIGCDIIFGHFRKLIKFSAPSFSNMGQRRHAMHASRLCSVLYDSFMFDPLQPVQCVPFGSVNTSLRIPAEKKLLFLVQHVL